MLERIAKGIFGFFVLIILLSAILAVWHMDGENWFYIKVMWTAYIGLVASAIIWMLVL